MTSQALQLVTDSHSPTVNDSMSINSPPSGNDGYNVMNHLFSNYRVLTQNIHDLTQSIIDIIGSEPDNTNLTKMQWDTYFTTIGEAQLNASIFINEIHATSREIRDRITAGISRQLRLAMDEGEGGIAVSESSKDSLFEFAKMQKITRPPFVILRDNGNLSTTWNYENGDKFKLVFLCDDSLNYVSFLNRSGKREIAHGNCDIKGVMEFIQSNDILL